MLEDGIPVKLLPEAILVEEEAPMVACPATPMHGQYVCSSCGTHF
jgi:hypothetical protein